MTPKPIAVLWVVRVGSVALLAAFASCAPQAIFFHEATKVGFSATYNISDAQPVSSHFGYKRRIVAVVPGQERVPAASGKEEDATNRGDALSLVSKFYVKVGTREQGIEIRNNFATGNAARALTSSSGSSRAVDALMHNQVVVTPAVKNVSASSDVAPTPRVTELRRKRTSVTESSPSGGASPAPTIQPLPDSSEPQAGPDVSTQPSPPKPDQ